MDAAVHLMLIAALPAADPQIGVDQVGMAIGDPVHFFNEGKAAAWAIGCHPIRELLDLLVHPAKMVVTRNALAQLLEQKLWQAKGSSAKHRQKVPIGIRYLCSHNKCHMLALCRVIVASALCRQGFRSSNLKPKSGSD